MYKYQSEKKQAQKAELMKWLEQQVKAGKVINRAHYAQIISKMMEKIPDDDMPITKQIKVKSDEQISSSAINDFMRDLSIDIGSAFRESKDIGRLVDRRKNSSKKFYADVKSDINSLNKSLGLQRSNAFGGAGSDQDLYIESFRAPADFRMYDTTIEGKKGELRLAPYDVERQSVSDSIEKVELTVYPVDNDAGGVSYVSVPERDIVKNYSSGSRDMLENGTWELKVVTAKDADIYFEGKKHSGIIVLLDIYLEANKKINYIEFDPLGKYSQEIMYIKYKTDIDGSWEYLKDKDGKALRGISSESIEFLNFQAINPILVRFAIKQDDNVPFNKDVSEYSISKEKLEDDKSGGRVAAEKRIIGQEAAIKSYDDDDSEGSLYELILSDLEMAENPEEALKIVESYLKPPTNSGTKVSGNKIYTLGAHSIDLEKRAYRANQIGIFYSHDPDNTDLGYYVNTNRIAKTEVTLLPTAATVEASYKIPGASTVEFFITDADNNLAFAIMPLNSSIYREPAQFVRSQYNNTLAIQLTFPINVPVTEIFDYPMSNFIKVYKNGELTSISLEPIDPVSSVNFIDKSSRQFAIPGINPSYNDIYVVEYKPDQINSVIAWVIDAGLNPTNSNCVSNYKDHIFANKKLADNKIAGHGAGCKCRAVPTYIKINEWEAFGITSTGTGTGYSSLKPNIMPIPLAIKRKEKPGD